MFKRRWYNVLAQEKSMMDEIDTLEFGSALRLVPAMLRTSRETVALAETIAASLEPNVCAGKHISFPGNVDHSVFRVYLTRFLGVSSFIFVMWVAWAKFCGGSRSRTGSMFSKSKTVKIN